VGLAAYLWRLPNRPEFSLVKVTHELTDPPDIPRRCVAVEAAGLIPPWWGLMPLVEAGIRF
jgi:hypothetical protein